MGSHKIITNVINQKNISKFRDVLREKILFVDTSFLRDSLSELSQSRVIKDLLLSWRCGLAYNITIQSEFIHNMRSIMFAKNDEVNSMFSKEKLRKPLQTLKELALDKKNSYLLKKVFGNEGEFLKEEVERGLEGCVYYGAKEKVGAKWDDVYKIMGATGLDSSDAMIFNMAIHNPTFTGILSTDGDFELCKKYPIDLKNNFYILVIEEDKKTVNKR